MTCKGPKVEAGDWPRFDFTRWGTEGLPLDDPDKFLGALAERLFASPEWRQQVAAGLPQLREGMLKYFDERGQAIDARKAEQDAAVKDRLISIKEEQASLQERMKAAVAPAQVTANPESYQLAARVVEEKSRLGLPGLTVRLLMPDGGKAIAETSTNSDGNAVIVVPAEQASALAGIEVGIQVSTAHGKVVHEAEHAVCPRVGQVETWVGSVPAGRDIAPLVAVAEEQKARRADRVGVSAEKARLVREEYERWRKDVECDEDEARAVMEDIRKESAAHAAPGKAKGTKKRRKK